MASPSMALPATSPADRRWLWTLFLWGASWRSMAALAAVRRLCDHDLRDSVQLRIQDACSDPAAAAQAGVLAVPCLVGGPRPELLPRPEVEPEPEALQRRIEHLEAVLEAITSGTADALLLGSNGPAGAGATFFLPEGTDQPYRAIVEQMGEGIGILGAEGQLLYANPRLAELLEQPPGAVLGRPLADLLPPAQRDCLQLLRKVPPGRSERAELELPRAEGGTCRVLAVVSALVGSTVGTQCLTLTDLSDLEWSRVPLAREDHRVHLLAETLAAFVVETDAQRRVRWVSPSIQAVLGWMPLELVGGSIADLLHWEDSLDVALPSTQDQLIVRLRAKDGTNHWMRCLSWALQGQGRTPSSWMTGFQAVDDLVEQRQASATDQARLAAVLLSLAEPQIVLDTLRWPDGAAMDFVFTAVNEAACRQTGLPRQELLGRRLLEAFPAPAAKGLFALCHQAMESEDAIAWGDLDGVAGADSGQQRRTVRVARVRDVLSCSWGCRGSQPDPGERSEPAAPAGAVSPGGVPQPRPPGPLG